MQSQNKVYTKQILNLLEQISSISLNEIIYSNATQQFDSYFHSNNMKQRQQQQQQSCQFDKDNPIRSYDEIDEYFNQISNQTSSIEYHELQGNKLEYIDAICSFNKSREKLFRRHRYENQREFRQKIQKIQKELSTNEDQSDYTLRTDQYKLPIENKQRDESNRKISKKQISFKSNSNKIEQLHFQDEDIQKLLPDGDLNDNIIENYIKIVKSFFLTSRSESKIHIFSTFFFSKLMGASIYSDFDNYFPKEIERVRKIVNENYPTVKRWTKSTDIFDKQLIIFPINAFNHWFCLLILNPYYLNHSQENHSQKCQIIYLDSMFYKKQLIVDAIKEYLFLQYLSKKGKSIKFLRDDILSYQLLLPRQLNGHDCGLFMLVYLDQLLNNQYHLKNLHLIQNRNKLRLFPRRLILTMRHRFIKLIQKLNSNNSQQANTNMLHQFLKEKKDIILNSSDNDYDEINEQEFIKYKTFKLLDLYQLTFAPEQQDYCLKIKFYFDPEINYLQKDK